jgi:hypothetical protein
LSALQLPVFGDPRLPPRFWAKVRVDEVTGCWIWIGGRKQEGYGRFSIGRKIDGSRRSVRAHCYAYLTLVGPIPAGLELDHVRARGCVGPACCNPAHLEPVTHRVNCQRGDAGARNKAKTHCRAGHELPTETTYLRPNRGAERVCRVCAATRGARWYMKHRAALLVELER